MLMLLFKRGLGWAKMSIDVTFPLFLSLSLFLSLLLSPVDLFATCAGQMLGCFGAGSVAESPPKRTHLFLPLPLRWGESVRSCALVRKRERKKE